MGTAIEVAGVWKKFRRGERFDSLRDLLPAMARRVVHGRSTDLETREFWALRDISLTVPHGEALGVIGPNGAGKSTLLKLLSRVLRPTRGQIRLQGRLSALLETSAGFHPDLTGRENVFLNAAILGMSKAEILRKFDEIVAFSGLEAFIDTPVKRYSSGMYARLGFAVAAHIEPDVLLVDEVLAVGDAGFQKRCLGKMGEVTREGRTVVFVSHNMGAVQELCQRCVAVSGGRIVADGPPSEVVTTYMKESYGDVQSSYHATPGATPGAATLLEAALLDGEGQACDKLRFGEPFAVRLRWEHHAAIPEVSYSIRAHDERGRFLFAANTLGSPLGLDRPGVHEVVCRFDANVFVPGGYYLSVGCFVRPHTTVQVVDPCLHVVVLNAPAPGIGPFTILGDPLVAVHHRWSSH